MSEKREDSPFGLWSSKWLKTAKEVARDTVDLVKKDLSELKEAIVHEMAELSTAAKESLTEEKVAWVKQVVKTVQTTVISLAVVKTYLGEEEFTETFEPEWKEGTTCIVEQPRAELDLCSTQEDEEEQQNEWVDWSDEE